MPTLDPDGRVIVIAERDHNVRELQKYFLMRAGFAPEFADDGQVALERVRSILPVLVITEILIPKIDGLALCRRLSDDPMTQHIPVLIFSILAAAERAAEAGAKAFLRKPLIESIFVATVQDLIATLPTEAREKKWASQ